MWNILICTSSFNKKNINKKFLNKNFKIKYNPYGRKLTDEEVYSLVDKKTVAIISGTEKISKKILNKAENLQIISRCGTGTDNIDKLLLNSHIKIYKTDKEPVPAVAEFVVAQILGNLKETYYHNLNLRKQKWTKIKGKMLYKNKVGIIGYGKVGKKIKSFLKPFKCEVNIYDKYIKKFSNKKILNKLLKNSNIVTLNIPLCYKNKYFINKVKLNLMKKNAVLINCSRGELIDEVALLDHLKRNENFKAILDCFQNEPYNGPLCKQNNVTLSPHIASFTDETRNLMEQNSFLNCVKNIDLKKLGEKN